MHAYFYPLLLRSATIGKFMVGQEMLAMPQRDISAQAAAQRRRKIARNLKLEAMIVDSHQHFWQLGHFDYPWMRPEVEVLYRDSLPPTLEPTLKACGVAQTVVVQASNSLAETYWLLSLAERYPFIAGVVGWVDHSVGKQHDRQLEHRVAH